MQGETALQAENCEHIVIFLASMFDCYQYLNCYLLLLYVAAGFVSFYIHQYFLVAGFGNGKAIQPLKSTAITIPRNVLPGTNLILNNYGKNEFVKSETGCVFLHCFDTVGSVAGKHSECVLICQVCH